MKVEIYSKDNCGFCDMAIKTAEMNSIDPIIKKLEVDFTREEIMEQFPGVKTFPIVVVDGENIGGYQEFTRYLREVR